MQGGECQWAEAPKRSRSVRFMPDEPEAPAPSAPSGMPAILRPPVVPVHTLPGAPPDVYDNAPPAVTGLSWKPVVDLEVTSQLDLYAMNKSGGWRTVKGEPWYVELNARALRSCEPRYDSSTWTKRSTFAMFPANVHEAGTWWQLELEVVFAHPSYAHRNCQLVFVLLLCLCTSFTKATLQTQLRQK